MEDYGVLIGQSSENGNPNGNYSYSWSPATGLSNPSISNPVASPTETTTYTVTVTDVDNNCSSTAQITITVTPTIEPQFTNPGPVCVGTNFTLPTMSNNGIQGSWSPVANNQETTTYTFTPNPGQCGKIITMEVVVQDDPIPTFTNQGSICAGTALTLPTTSLNGIQGSWSPAADNQNTTTYHFTPNANGCAVSTDLTVEVNETETPIINSVGATCDTEGESSITNVVQGGDYTFTPPGPTLGDGGVVNGMVVGTDYTVTLTTNGCTSQATAPFSNDGVMGTLATPIVQIQAPDCGIDGSASISNYHANYTYVFIPQGPTITGNGTIVGMNFNDNYSVYATINSGCSSDTTFPFSILPQLPIPTMVIIGDAVICSGGMTSIAFTSPQQGVVYSWTSIGNVSGSSNGTGSSIIQTLVGNNGENVTYTVTPTLGSCVGNPQSFTVTISNGGVHAEFTASTSTISSISTEVDFNNLSIGASSYSWDFGDGTPSTNQANPSHAYPDGIVQNYVVTLIAANDVGCKDTAIFTIKTVEDIVFFVPNTFTPDGNQYNNVFKPIFANGYDNFDYEMTIYDRWGERIFETKDTNIGWDGVYLLSGKVCQEGAYVWKIKIRKAGTSVTIEKFGHITLLR